MVLDFFNKNTDFQLHYYARQILSMKHLHIETLVTFGLSEKTRNK